MNTNDIHGHTRPKPPRKAKTTPADQARRRRALARARRSPADRRLLSAVAAALSRLRPSSRGPPSRRNWPTRCTVATRPDRLVSWLHRRLVGPGVKNLVVRPRNWDEYGKEGEDRPAGCAGLALVPGSVCGRQHRRRSRAFACLAEAEEQSRSSHPPARPAAGASQAPGRPGPELRPLLRRTTCLRNGGGPRSSSAAPRAAGVSVRAVGKLAADRRGGPRAVRRAERSDRVRRRRNVLPTGLGALTSHGARSRDRGLAALQEPPAGRQLHRAGAQREFVRENAASAAPSPSTATRACATFSSRRAGGC